MASHVIHKSGYRLEISGLVRFRDTSVVEPHRGGWKYVITEPYPSVEAITALESL
jgi:hypothetical protein